MVGASRSVGTHDGLFHADEVTACALLIVADQVDRDQIFRTRNPKLLERCEYICDVGGVYDPEKKLFDHHQSDYQGELSSAGMVLRYLAASHFLSEEEARFLSEWLVMGVDAHDNGKIWHQQGVCIFSHLIANFTPIPYDSTPEELEKGFFEALDFTIDQLDRALKRFRAMVGYRQQVKDCMARSTDCLVFHERLPWLENFFSLGGENHPAKFVIMPTGDHWKLRGMPPSMKERMGVRFPLPAAWAGLLDEALVEASGIEGAIFCHKGRFISVWATLEDAQRALQIALEGG